MEQAGTGLLNHKDFLSWLSTQFNLERKGWWHPRAEGQQEICAFFLVLSLFCEVHIQTQKGCFHTTSGTRCNLTFVISVRGIKAGAEIGTQALVWRSSQGRADILTLVDLP